jgi:hypothetical protein
MSNHLWPSILDQVILPIILTLYINYGPLTINYLNLPLSYLKDHR